MDEIMANFESPILWNALLLLNPLVYREKEEGVGIVEYL